MRATDSADNTDPTPATADLDNLSTPDTALTFSPAADARVLESSPTSNYGPSATLAADGGADPDVESYLRFNVTGVSGPVTNVKLRLHTTSNAVSASSNGPAATGTVSLLGEPMRSHG